MMRRIALLLPLAVCLFGCAQKDVRTEPSAHEQVAGKAHFAVPSQAVLAEGARIYVEIHAQWKVKSQSFDIMDRVKGAADTSFILDLMQQLNHDQLQYLFTYTLSKSGQKSEDGFREWLIQAFVVRLVSMGERELLLELFSNDFPGVTACRLTEYFVVDAGREKITRPILVLTEAYDLAKRAEVKKRLAEALRQAFVGQVWQKPTEPDEAFVRRCAEWYQRNGQQCILNEEYFVTNRFPPGFQVPLLVLKESLRKDGSAAPVAKELSAQEQAAQEEKAIKTLLEFGGAVTRDANLPGSPVVALDLVYPAIAAGDLKALQGLRHLQVLNLVGKVWDSDCITDETLAQLSQFKGLRKLGLSETGISDAGLKGLKEIKGLLELDLSDTRITPAGLKELKDIRNLRDLNLNHDQVEEAGLKELKVLKSLRRLCLRSTGITDAGLKDLKELKGLRELDLSQNEITDASLKDLKELRGLQKLDLSETNITQDGLKDLRQSMPGTTINGP